MTKGTSNHCPSLSSSRKFRLVSMVRYVLLGIVKGSEIRHGIFPSHFAYAQQLCVVQ